MPKKLSHQEIVERQSFSKQQPKIPVSVVLNNIRSLYNVGSIFRTADGAGIEKIWLCGITGHPPSNQISKTALGAENEVPWEHHPSARSIIKHLKTQGYHVVSLEQTDHSQPYQEFQPHGKTCLVIGNEIEGVDQNIVDLCDDFIEIEMAGLKNSLNVSVAFGIVVYQIRSAILSLQTFQK